MTPSNSERYLQMVRDECARIVGSRLIPKSIADELGESKSANAVLFSDHPVALATLPIAAYEAVGGKRSVLAAPAAAAMEFLLAAGDILDDLQDGDLTADSGPSPNNYVRATELITVLLLLAEYAIQSLDSNHFSAEQRFRVYSIFTKFKLKAFSGQFDDAHAVDSSVTTPKSVLERTQEKSGSLGACAGILGAILGTPNVEKISMATQYGEHLGIVYQLKNDVLDIWPGYGSMDDVTSGKSTSPTAFTLALSDEEKGNSPLSNLLENPYSESAALEDARTEVFGSGGVHFTMIQIFSHIARANTLAKNIANLQTSKQTDSTLVL